jgi:formiminotetrahydrofolate cyclodeaminase
LSLLDLDARGLLDRFASTDPTPGGGSAAAWAGATGAALVAMVSGMEKTRTGSPVERTRLEAVRARVGAAGDALRLLVDEDSAAYDAVMAAYRLPKQTDGEKASRKASIQAAMERATDVPLRTAAACLTVLLAAVDAAADGNPSAVSDALTGGALAWAGLQGALENVRINTRDDHPARARALELSAAAADALGRLGLG